MYFTSRTYAAQNPKAVASFTAAMNRSMEYATAHPDEARAILPTYTKIDFAVQKDLVLPKWPATIDRGPVQRLADLALRDGLITKQPDLGTLLP